MPDDGIDDDGDLWYGTNADPIFGMQSAGVLHTHARHACVGRHCVLHNPSDHHMKTWPTVWRADRGLMERTCPHGVGHPDPDHCAYVKTVLSPEEYSVHGVHGCDGCCRA